MRALPNEFEAGYDLRSSAISPMPYIGWGTFVAALPLLTLYWGVLGIFMLAELLFKSSK